MKETNQTETLRTGLKSVLKDGKIIIVDEHKITQHNIINRVHVHHHLVSMASAVSI